jgi:perosamine synthetase
VTEFAPIPQMEPWFDQAEADALHAYMMSGGWVTEFRQTQAFEESLQNFTGAKHCIVTNNGTISLTLALLALGVEAGDEVITPDLTMIATPNAARLIGAVPVFVDIEAETLNIDIDQAAAAIGPKTAAVIHVSFNGRCNDIARLRDLCREKGVALIEDSAQALGCYRGGRHLGTTGDIGSFSFSAPKVISTGQGGALITDDDDIAARLRKLKDFGRLGGGNDIHDDIGFNFKFTDLQAVVGLEQMKKLPWRLARKKDIWRRYAEGLKGVGPVDMMATDLEQTSPWFIEVFVDDRAALAAHLKAHDIGSRPIYPPIHSQKAYGLNDLSFPVTERAAARGLWLPSSAKLTDADVDRVCAAVRDHYRA